MTATSYSLNGALRVTARSTHTIRELIDSGELDAHRTDSGRYRIDHGDLAAAGLIPDGAVPLAGHLTIDDAIDTLLRDHLAPVEAALARIEQKLDSIASSPSESPCPAFGNEPEPAENVEHRHAVTHTWWTRLHHLAQRLQTAVTARK